MSWMAAATAFAAREAKQGSQMSGAGSMQAMKYSQKFARNMRRTAFQDQVADLKKAGLNPILGMGTSGAGNPGGGMASIPDQGQAAAAGANAGSTAIQTLANIGKVDQEVLNMTTQELGYRIDNRIKESSASVMDNVQTIAGEIKILLDKYQEEKPEIADAAASAGKQLYEITETIQNQAYGTGQDASNILHRFKSMWNDFYNAIKTRDNFKEYMGVK